MQLSTLTRAAGLGLVAVLALSACGDTSPPGPSTTQPTVAPTEPTTDAPTDSGTESFDPTTGEPAPPLPEAFGEWSTTDASGGSLAYYEHAADGTQLDASVWTYTTREQIQDEAGAVSELIGEWYCGSATDNPEVASCTANAFDGTIQLRSNDLDVAGLAVAGDELLDVWQ